MRLTRADRWPARALSLLYSGALSGVRMHKVKLLWKRLRREVEETTETTKITMEGWLYKRGEVKTAWAKRWCTLNKEDLKYYKVKDSYSPQGVIPLETVAQVKSGRVAGLTEMNGEDTDNGFVVVTAERTFYFVAETNAEKYEWIQVCHVLPARMRGG